MGILAWQKEKQNSQCKTQSTHEYLSWNAQRCWFIMMTGEVVFQKYLIKLEYGHKKHRINLSIFTLKINTHHMRFCFNFLESCNIWKIFDAICLFISLPSLVCCQHLPLTSSYPSLFELICGCSLNKRKNSHFIAKQWLWNSKITFTINFNNVIMCVTVIMSSCFKHS